MSDTGPIGPPRDLDGDDDTEPGRDVRAVLADRPTRPEVKALVSRWAAVVLVLVLVPFVIYAVYAAGRNEDALAATQRAISAAEDIEAEQQAQRDAERAQLRDELDALAQANAQRQAEGLEPVPVPTTPPTASGDGSNVELIADIVTARVLAQLRPPLTPEQVSALVEARIAALPTPEDGADAPAPTPEQLGAAVAAYCASTGACRGEAGDAGTAGPAGPPGQAGPAGPQGPPGQAGPGPTPEQLAQAVADYITAVGLPLCPDGTSPEQVVVLTDQGPGAAVVCTLDEQPPA